MKKRHYLRSINDKESNYVFFLKIMKITFLILFANSFYMMALNSNTKNPVLSDGEINYNSEKNFVVTNQKNLSNNVFIGNPIFTGVQQNKTIRGTVRDAEGEPVIGVTIVIKDNPSHGTITDYDGNFSISNIPDNAILVFSYVGLRTQEIPLNGMTTIQVIMLPDTELLDEIIVVGYGTQKKVNLTGSVSSVKGEDISKRIVAQTSAALQGLVPGLTITQQSGQPGYDGGNLYIRGIGSINAGTQPLVLVDNVQMDINNIDPNTIESISVLKDAAAASIYGSRAANGVILITTKRSKDKHTQIKYNFNIGTQKATDFPKKVSAIEHMEMYDTALINVGRDPVFTDDIQDYKNNPIDNFERFDTDWADLLLTNNGILQSHNISVSSGSDNINIFANASYLNQNGLTPNTYLNKYNLILNTDIKLSDKVNLKVDLLSDNSKVVQPYHSPSLLIMHVVGLPAYLPGKFNDGSYGEAWNNFNPIGLAEAGGFNQRNNRTSLISSSLNYSPVSDLEILFNYSYRNDNNKSREMSKQYQVFHPDIANNILSPGSLFPSINRLDEQRSESYFQTARFQTSYQKESTDHQYGIIVGISAEDFRSDYLSGGRQNFINQEMPYLNLGDASTMTNGGGLVENSLLSFYSRINYNFKNRYLLELNGRYDGSSRFSKENRWGFFPSLSLGWRISEEQFWDKLKKYMDTKFRVSYGILGNQELNSYYPTVSSYKTGEDYNYFFNNSIVSGYAINDAANDEITWESAKQFNTGVDLIFLNNKLSLSYDYYIKNIHNMLQRLPIPLLVGLNAPFVNAGSMRNRGWEISAEWRDRVSSLEYNIRLNISNVENKVIDLHGEEYIQNLRIIRENDPINSYYGYISEGLFQNEEEITNSPKHFVTTKPGDIKYRDISGPDNKPDGVIDSFDREVLGNSFPKYEFSINADLKWKNFDLSIFLQGVGKKDNYLQGIGAWAFYSASYQGSAFEFHKNSWSQENPNALFPRLTVGIDNNQKNSSYWIKSGAYVRLKNLVFGYTIPTTITKKLNISQVRLFFSGQNLFTIHNFFDGFDPERDDNSGQFYPLMKSYNFGINLSIN